MVLTVPVKENAYSYITLLPVHGMLLSCKNRMYDSHAKIQNCSKSREKNAGHKMNESHEQVHDAVDDFHASKNFVGLGTSNGNGKDRLSRPVNVRGQCALYNVLTVMTNKQTNSCDK